MELLRLHVGESGGGLTQHEQILRYVVRLTQAAGGEIVVPAEEDHPTLAGVSVELKLVLLRELL
jgi:hypothetical protein